MTGTTLVTDRLVLRQWRDSDRAPWAALNADPEVMAHFPSTLDREESDAFVDRHRSLLEAQGWGLWAVEVRSGPSFIGFTGLDVPRFQAEFTPCVEVGWRLGRQHWGHGYATEAAHAALAHGFDVLGLDEIVSFTSEGNVRSRRVMERLGMELAGHFDHPNLRGHRLERHVWYRLTPDTRPPGQASSRHVDDRPGDVDVRPGRGR